MAFKSTESALKKVLCKFSFLRSSKRVGVFKQKLSLSAMFSHESNDDNVVNYHEIDHLGMSLPLKDDDDDKFFESVKQDFSIIGFSSNLPVYPVSKYGVVLFAGGRVNYFNWRRQMNATFKTKNILPLPILAVSMDDRKEYLATVTETGVSFWNISTKRWMGILKIEKVLDILWLERKNDQPLIAILRDVETNRVMEIYSVIVSQINGDTPISTCLEGTFEANPGSAKLYGKYQIVVITCSPEIIVLHTMSQDDGQIALMRCELREKVDNKYGKITTTEVSDKETILFGTNKGVIIVLQRHRAKRSLNSSYLVKSVKKSNLGCVVDILVTKRYYLVGDKRGVVTVFDKDTDNKVSQTQISTDSIKSIGLIENKCSRESFQVIMSDSGGRIFCSSISKNEEIVLNGTTFLLDCSNFHKISSIEIHPDGPLLVIGNTLGKIMMVDAESFEVLDTRILCVRQSEPITSLKFSPNGKALFCGGGSGRIWMLESLLCNTGSTDQVIKAANTTIRMCKFSGENTFVIVDDENYMTVFVRIVTDRPGWRQTTKFLPHLGFLADFSILPSDQENVLDIITVGEDQRVIKSVVDLRSDSASVKFSHPLPKNSQPTFVEILHHESTGQQFFFVGNSINQVRLVSSQTNFCRRIFRLASTKKVVKLNKNPTTSGHDIFAGLTLSGRFVQIFAVSLRCPSIHIIASFPRNGTNSENQICVGNDGSVYCLSTNADFFECHKNVIPPNVSNARFIEEVFPSPDVLEDILNCLKIVMSTDNVTQNDMIRIEKVDVILHALGMSTSKEQLEDFMNEFRFGRSVNSGHVDEEITIKDFMNMIENHFDFPSIFNNCD